MIEPRIDWNDIWRRKFEQSHNQYPLKKKKDFEESRKKSLEYLKTTEQSGKIKKILDTVPLSRESNVLDIGSGPGIMALPMSPRVAHITAIEPEEGAMAVLKEMIAKNGIDNITTIRKRWEDIDISQDLNGPYDLVIASYSLDMPHMKEAIEKMCAVSRKWVYLTWANSISTIEQRQIDLWPRLYGWEYYPKPKANILYNLLNDMEIYPNVKTEHRVYLQKFPDIETAVRKFKKTLDISTPEGESVIRDYLVTKFEFKNCEYSLLDRQVVATLWWDVSETGC